jgi:hypothetical protein
MVHQLSSSNRTSRGFYVVSHSTRAAVCSEDIVNVKFKHNVMKAHVGVEV